MMKSGQFVFFESLIEFEKWLNEQTVWRKITKVQQHHTWLPDYSYFRGDNDPKITEGENHLERMIALDNYHENVMKWSDSGHHFMTFPDGVIGYARKLNKNPAGIKGSNTGAICIEHLGNFDKDVMTELQKKTAVGMTGILLKRFKLKPNTDTVVYHHWFDLNTGKRTNGNWGYVKTCPGKKFFGGNKVQDAEKNFIPLVKKYMAGELFKEVIELAFTDINQASEWAKEKLKRAKELGLVNGRTDGSFDPQGPVTREALAVVAVNIYDAIMRDINK